MANKDTQAQLDALREELELARVIPPREEQDDGRSTETSVSGDGGRSIDPDDPEADGAAL